MGIRVLSYNIHKGFNASNNTFVLPQMRDAILTTNTDILFLQEAQGKQHPRKLKKHLISEQPQTEFLATDVWPYHVYAKNAVYATAHHGNGLLSRFPILAWENINVSSTKRASRSLLHGIIQLPNHPTPVHVICIHLGLFKAERMGQLDLLSECIKEKIAAHAPLIIAGDFNDWRGHAEDHLENELALQEVFKKIHGEHAKTFPARHPTLKVDRIYFR